MNRPTLLAVTAFFASASGLGAQQAAMPTPPKTVNPLPVSTTECRGCSDSNDAPKPQASKYDEKQTGTVRADVKPNVVTKKVTAKSHPKKHTHKRAATRTKPATPKAAVIKVKADTARK